MIVVAIFLFLVASVPAAGADAAVDGEVQSRRRVYAARAALRGFESDIEDAFKRATDRQSAFDGGGAYLLQRSTLLLRSFWRIPGMDYLPESERDLCHSGRVALALSREHLVMLRLGFQGLARAYERNDVPAEFKPAVYELWSIEYDLANAIFIATEQGQRVVTLACPAEDSLANVPGVSDVCKGLRVDVATTDTLVAIDPSWGGEGLLSRPDVSAFGRHVDVEMTCGDGWLSAASDVSTKLQIDRICKSARESLATLEQVLAARDHLLALGGLSVVPPSLAADFARAVQHLRKGKDQLCE